MPSRSLKDRQQVGDDLIGRSRGTAAARRSILATAACLILAGPALTAWLWTLPSAREAAIAAVLVVAPAFATVGFGIWQQFKKHSPEFDSLQAYEAHLAKIVAEEWYPWRSRTLGNDAAPAEIRFYERIARYRFLGAMSPTRLTRVLRSYQETKPAALLIIGAPGTGKTVLCIEFLFHLLRARTDDDEQPVPILLSLGNWHTGTLLVTWICEQLATIYRVSKTISRILIEEGRLLIILDGLEDALGPDDKKPGTVAVIDSLRAAIGGALRSRIIVTCRYSKSAAVEKETDPAVFQVLHIDSLEPPQVARYLAGRYRSISKQDSIDPNWQTVHDRLMSRRPGVLGLAFKTPWRLSIATTAVDAGQIAPADLINFESLQKFDDDLLARFIPASLALASARRGKKLRFTVVQYRLWLATLANDAFKEPNAAHASGKLVISQLWPIAGRHRVRMLHGFVSVIGGALLGVNGAEFASGSIGFLSAGIYALTGAGLGVWAAIDPAPSPSRLSLRGLRSWRSIGICSALAAGEGLLNSLGGGPAVGVTVGLLCLTAGVIVTGFRGGIGKTPRPTDKIHDDLIFGVGLGLVIGLASGLPGGFTGGLIYELGVKKAIGYVPSVFVALLIGIVCGVAIGARSWLRYMCACAIWVCRRILPFRLAGFLQEAYEVDVLRAAGGAYDFRHDNLGGWLAEDFSHEKSRLVPAVDVS